MNGRALLAALLVLGWLAPVAASPRSAFDQQVDALVYDGGERPQQALEALQQLQQPTRSADEQRVLQQAIGMLHAQSGAAGAAASSAAQLLALAGAGQPAASALAVASSNLVRAMAAQHAGRLDAAATLAQAALPAFEAACPPAVAALPRGAPTCDYRAAWQALLILQRRDMTVGLTTTETEHAQAALALAEWAGDTRRQSTNLARLALLAHGRGERDLGERLLGQARRLAAQSGDPAQQAHVCDTEARLAHLQDQHNLALHFREQARALAVQAGAPGLEARMLTNLSDGYERVGRHAEALRAAESALVIVRRLHDTRTERLLINNAGIAKIGLGRVAQGKQDMARLLELWRASGDDARRIETLTEFGEALAAAGDLRSALDLYHQERDLTAELMQRNRNIALKELRSRNDAEARRRDIELLARDNALKSGELVNHELQQRIGYVLAALLLLATALVTALYRRVRLANRHLASSQVQLQAQSERDPLTNLANRRHFQTVMTQLASGRGFEGALLLVDIDHFKRVNDVQGHAAGDHVLVEVARRLNEGLRAGDLVVRWGGEEFLILAPMATLEQARQMAQRVLDTLADVPIVCGMQALRITASIGYGRFPLAPHATALAWERALNLADMALYIAKSQGRNRAVGIVSTTAATAAALREVESDFDRAWHEGRVTLLQTHGPEAGAGASAVTAAAS